MKIDDEEQQATQELINKLKSKVNKLSDQNKELSTALATATQRIVELEQAAAYELARRGKLTKWYATYMKLGFEEWYAERDADQIKPGHRWQEMKAKIDQLSTDLAAANARAEAAERNASQLDALAREYSAMQERTQRHAQEIESAMLRWQARAEAAERERDAWQRNAAMWHDKAEVAEAKIVELETELATVYSVAIERGKALGYTDCDHTWRSRLTELRWAIRRRKQEGKVQP